MLVWPCTDAYCPGTSQGDNVMRVVMCPSCSDVLQLPRGGTPDLVNYRTSSAPECALVKPSSALAFPPYLR